MLTQMHKNCSRRTDKRNYYKYFIKSKNTKNLTTALEKIFADLVGLNFLWLKTPDTE